MASSSKTSSNGEFLDRIRDNLAPCWKYFLWRPATEEVKCKECSKVLQAKGQSTKGMITHLKSIHKITLDSKCSPGRKPANMLMDKFVTVTPKSNPNKETPDEVVAKLCAVDGIPMKTVAESEMLAKAFKSYGITLPKSPNTVRKLLMENFEKVKAATVKKIELALSNNVRFSLTLDEYTSNANKGYMNVNLHLGDGSVVNLGIIEMPPSCPADVCVEKLEKK